MENWDGLSYGPLTIDLVEGRLVRFGEIMIGLGKSEFVVLLCLMACQGGVVSHTILARAFGSGFVTRFVVHRLRRRLLEHVGGSVEIEHARHYGYKLSLARE